MGKRFTAYDLPLAIFLISAGLGVLPAYEPSLSMMTLAALLGGGLIYAAISRLARNRARWDAAAFGLASVVSLVAVYFVSQSGHMGYAEKIPLLAHAAAWLALLTPDLAFWKPLGNTVGTFLEGGLFIVLGLALVERRPFLRVMLLIGLGFTALALLFSASRGAWMAVLGAGLIWAALYSKKARWLALAGGVVLAGLALYALSSRDINVLGDLPLVGRLLGSLFVRPDRLEVYYNSLALIRDVPFTGIGLSGQFGMVYSRYGLLLHVPFLYYAHNLFLDIWLGQGLPGIFAWLWLILSIFTAAWRWRKMDSAGTRIRFESTWIGLAAVFIHGFTDARQAQAVLTWLPFFVLLGLNAALILHDRFEPQPRDRCLGYLPVLGGLLGLLLALANVWPLPAALYANRAALIQHRADLASHLTQVERDALLDQAAGLFEQTLDMDPGNRTANQRLGLIALSRHEFTRAVQYLRPAYEADTRHPGTRKALGLAYAFSGKLEEAAPLLGDQLNIVEELNYWGGYYTSHGWPQAGLNAMRLSLMLHPDQPHIRDFIDQAQ